MFDTEKYDEGFAAALLDWVEGGNANNVNNDTVAFNDGIDCESDSLAPWNLL